MASYATAHLCSQFRTHVFSFLIFPSHARLMKWDRAGAVFTGPIPLKDSLLAEFFWKYSYATPEQRGYDCTVKPFHNNLHLTKRFIIEQLGPYDGDQSPGSHEVSLYEVSMPSSLKSYIVSRPIHLGISSLPSRATRVFKAWSQTRSHY